VRQDETIRLRPRRRHRRFARILRNADDCGAMKPRLLVLNQTCLDVIDRHREWIAAQGFDLIEPPAAESLHDADAVILPANHRTFPRGEQMADAPLLRVCSIAASGFEWLDVESATRLGIVVTNVVGREGAEVVADMTFAMM